MKCKICDKTVEFGYLCTQCENKYNEYLSKLGIIHDWKIGDIVYTTKSTVLAGKRMRTICKVRYMGPGYWSIEHLKGYLDGKFYKRIDFSMQCVTLDKIDKSYIQNYLEDDYKSLDENKSIYTRCVMGEVFKTYEECFKAYKTEAVDNVIAVKKQMVLDIINKKLDSVFTNSNIIAHPEDLDENKLAEMIMIDSANEVELQKKQKEHILNTIQEEIKKEQGKIELNENNEINRLKQESQDKLDNLIKVYTDNVKEQYTKSINNINVNIKDTTLKHLESVLALNNYYLKLGGVKELKYNVDKNDLIVINKDNNS